MRQFTEFFEPDLIPMIRRMTDRPQHDSAGVAENAQIRAAVWRGLVSLGAPGLPLPASTGTHATGAEPAGARSGGAQSAGQEGLFELAELLGSVLYQGPLLDTWVAVELLLRTPDVEPLLTEIRDGASVALAVREDGAESPAEPGDMTVHSSARAAGGNGGNPGPGDTVTGTRCFVNFAAEVEYLLVAGCVGAAQIGLALVGRDHPSVTVARHQDLSRGELCRVELTAAPVVAWLGGADPAGAWEHVLAMARIRQAGYLVGLSQAALDLAVEHSKRRRQFGQAIGRFQALAFRMSAATANIDAARLLARDAARQAHSVRDEQAHGAEDARPTVAELRQAADHGGDLRLAAAQCLALAAETTRDTVVEAMQIHGALGMLSGSDVQLYYRRAAVEALWLGSPAQLRAETLPLLRQQSEDLSSML